MAGLSNKISKELMVASAAFLGLASVPQDAQAQSSAPSVSQTASDSTARIYVLQGENQTLLRGGYDRRLAPTDLRSLENPVNKMALRQLMSDIFSAIDPQATRFDVLTRASLWDQIGGTILKNLQTNGIFKIEIGNFSQFYSFDRGANGILRYQTINDDVSISPQAIAPSVDDTNVTVAVPLKAGRLNDQSSLPMPDENDIIHAGDVLVGIDVVLMTKENPLVDPRDIGRNLGPYGTRFLNNLAKIFADDVKRNSGDPNFTAKERAALRDVFYSTFGRVANGEAVHVLLTIEPKDAKNSLQYLLTIGRTDLLFNRQTGDYYEAQTGLGFNPETGERFKLNSNYDPRRDPRNIFMPASWTFTVDPNVNSKRAPLISASLSDRPVVAQNQTLKIDPQLSEEVLFSLRDEYAVATNQNIPDTAYPEIRAFFERELLKGIQGTGLQVIAIQFAGSTNCTVTATVDLDAVSGSIRAVKPSVAICGPAGPANP